MAFGISLLGFLLMPRAGAGGVTCAKSTTSPPVRGEIYLLARMIALEQGTNVRRPLP
jgi:hypothetical protein